MAHENLKEHLYTTPGKNFVANITHAVYSWSKMVPEQYYEYRIFEELTIRYETGEQTRLGLAKNDHYRFDTVFFIKPGYRAVNQNQCFTVGIELKNSAEDLKYDEKIHYYLGWTDYFMIGVPSALIDEAKTKIMNIAEQHPETQNRIGLMNVETGDIVIIPRKQNVTQTNKVAIQEQIIYNCIFKDVKAISFTLDEVLITPVELKDEYREVDSTFSTTDSATESPASLYTPISVQPQSATTVPLSTPPNIQSATPVQLSEEEIAEQKERAKQQRQANAAKEAERITRLAERGESLPPTTAAMYNQLKPNAKEVFWAIVDNGGHSRREQIAETTKMSLPTIDRSLPELTKTGIIEHEGSRKTGMFVVKASIDKSGTCDTCAIKDSCKFSGAAEGRCAKHK